MKLSEAIKEGAKLRPQIYFNSFAVNKDGELGSCALGAAQEAVTGEAKPSMQSYSDLFDGYDRNVMLKCPGCGRRDSPKWIIVCLNDNHRCTREQIADWLEQEGY